MDLEVNSSCKMEVGLRMKRGVYDDDVVVDRKKKKKKKKSLTFKNSDLFFPSPSDNLKNMYLDEEEEEDTYFDFDLLDDYPPYDSDMVCEIEKGKPVDIQALLSNLVTKGNHPVDVPSLKGKYVLICSFFLPLVNYGDGPNICRAMGALYSELYECYKRDDFEMVMVAKMRTAWDSETVFDHFFSGFHPKCLTIPYSDVESRDFVCRSLGLTDFDPAGIVINPDGVVLQDDPRFLVSFGADSFPFTDDHFDSLRMHDELIKLRLDATYKEEHRESLEGFFEGENIGSLIQRPVSLMELLQCDYLSTGTSDGGGTVPSSISLPDLSQKKVVALYLCYDGSFMQELNQLHRKCIEQGREFEIVLVGLLFEHDPSWFYHHITAALDKFSISSWWLFPFNDKLCRTLWRLFYKTCEDQLIIMPSPGTSRSGELLGQFVASSYGMIAYPFTRETILNAKESTLRSLTLVSLLGEDELLVRKKGKSTSFEQVTDLQVKNILLYLEEPDFIGDTCLYRLLLDYYDDIRAAGAEVVYIPMESIGMAADGDLPPEMPWLMLPQTTSASSVIKQLFLKDLYPDEPSEAALIAFGKHGKILSREAGVRLHTEGDIAALFEDHLRPEMIELFDRFRYDGP